jgi:hypothetical protein
VDVEYEQGLPARGVLAAFLLSSDTTAAAPKGGTLRRSNSRNIA